MGNPITKSKNSDHHSQNGSSTSKNGSKLPEFLSNMASILERKIQTNEKMLRRSRTKERVTIYHGTRPPTLSIRQYLSRVFEYSNCSPSCFVVGYIYMEKFIQQSGCYVTTLNVHRILLACVLVAVKFLEDECFNNAYLAKIGGVSTAEINRLEIKLLLTLNYRIYVSPEAFHHYSAMLASAAENEGPGTASRILQLVWSEREPVKQRSSKTRR
ncbi:hypothetical protein RND81_09G042600 [Saponaria officinalis]|uniref:Cyclin n=1 Tax=Saponaria officinalis TaxID=3572 RepID=A0AAW1IIN2_SAPOF